MDLLERYLQAVKFWLPKKQQSDILAELTEDIQSQIDEMESSLGRPLNKAEMEDVLKKRGRPMLVAMRYRPQRHLIGPEIFPMYWFVLKVAMLCYWIPWTLAGIALLIFGTSHPIGRILGQIWGAFWVSTALQFSIITLVFAFLDHYKSVTGCLDNWNPGKLPAVRPARDPYRISRINSIAEIIFTLIFIGWWIWMPQGFPFWWGFNEEGIKWSWGPVWSDYHTHFFLAVIVLSLFGVAVSSVNLFHPYWTRIRLAVRAGIDGSVAAMAYFVVMAHRAEVKAQFALLTGSHPPMDKSELVATIVNVSIFGALAIVVVAAGIQALVKLVQMLRYKESQRGIKAGAVALLFVMTLGAFATRAQTVRSTTHSSESCAYSIYKNGRLGFSWGWHPHSQRILTWVLNTANRLI